MTGRILFWGVLWLWAAISTAVYVKRNRRSKLSKTSAKVIIRASLSAFALGFTCFVWFCFFAAPK